MPQITMLNRREELRRRVDALPREVAAWQKRCREPGAINLNAHHSQLEDLVVLMAAYETKQRDLLPALDPAKGFDVFHEAAGKLVDAIIEAQRAWDFFRDKLELRFSPTFQKPLGVADTVAWDCHRPVMLRAVDEGILDRALLRSPPLTYLAAAFSPVTWMRGTRPLDGRDYPLGTSTTPIPVIEIPWDHVENLWELLSIHHEVGHDLEADLKLRQPLQHALNFQLSGAGVPNGRVMTWYSWAGEVFADLVAVQLGGPAYIEMLLHLLLGPADKVTAHDDNDPHPTPYLRILMNTAYARTLVPDRPVLIDHVGRIETRWKALYGEQPQLKEYTDDFPHVFEALMNTPLDELKGKTVRDLVPFTATDDARIRAAADYLRTGQNGLQKGTVAPRFCISAARLAVTDAAATPDTLAATLQGINDRTYTLVQDNTPGGLRAGGMGAKRKAFVAGFADVLGKTITPAKE